jgi:hypothetical protein
VVNQITLDETTYHASQIGAKRSKSDGNIGSKKPNKDPTVPMKPTFDANAKGDDSNQPIREEIGQFRYLADHTRPDLLASVSFMGSRTANPHDEHVVRTFAEYIATSHDVGLTLGGEPEVDLFGFSDAAYLTKSGSLSRLAYCFFLNLTNYIYQEVLAKTIEVKYINTNNQVADILTKPFLPYAWSNTLFPGNLGQAYTQRTRIPLTQEEEVLRGQNNTPLFLLQERKRIIRERAHNELIADHDSMYSRCICQLWLTKLHWT